VLAALGAATRKLLVTWDLVEGEEAPMMMGGFYDAVLLLCQPLHWTTFESFPASEVVLRACL